MTTELERLAATSENGSQEIGEFLDWLSTQGLEVARWDDDTERLVPTNLKPERLLAMYFDIDLDKVEAERRELLQASSRLDGGNQ